MRKEKLQMVRKRTNNAEREAAGAEGEYAGSDRVLSEHFFQVKTRRGPQAKTDL